MCVCCIYEFQVFVTTFVVWELNQKCFRQSVNTRGVFLSPCAQLKLGHYCHAGMFGTFLGNSAKEREESGVMTDTLSAWTVLNGNNPDFLNFLYSESESCKV